MYISVFVEWVRSAKCSRTPSIPHHSTPLQQLHTTTHQVGTLKLGVEFEEYRDSLLAVLDAKERKIKKDQALTLCLTPGAPVRCVLLCVFGAAMLCVHVCVCARACGCGHIHTCMAGIPSLPSHQTTHHTPNHTPNHTP